MTIAEFRSLIQGMASERMKLEAYSDYLQHKRNADGTNPNKRLREEYLPILAVINARGLPEELEIELGDDRETWDAKLSNGLILEVVQALPDREHEIRLEIASGGATPATYFMHSADHHQFPDAIVRAIKSKVAKNYPEKRILIVAFDGDYSFEEDAVIESWLPTIRQQAVHGNFEEVLLVERDRSKVFRIF